MKKIIWIVFVMNMAFLNAQNAMLSPNEPNTSGTGYNMDISMFPKIDSLVRHVFFLDTKINEKDAKIELVAYKTMEVDPCNTFYLEGKFEKRVLKDWNYGYFLFQTSGNIRGTKMGCASREIFKKDIPSSDKETLNYISRYPIVVYAPRDVMIKYTIWTSDKVIHHSTVFE